MININNLGYRYSRKATIFRELNFSLMPGKIYGLLGKNGAGKSTLIKNITGMLFPTEGTCEVFGSIPRKRQVSFLKELFFVPEEYYLPNLTIQELVTIYKDFYPNFDSNQFDNYTKEFKIEKNKRTTQLSLGHTSISLPNLILNAIEACKDSEHPKISISAKQTNKGAGIIKVSDNGKGIPDEIVDKIFIPFFSSKKNGSGIGLSLCQQIMFLHKGKIQVNTIENSGTVIQLLF